MSTTLECPTVSVFMDVEDPINLRSDDAAKDIAELFTEAGVRGSFCVTGEKCRTLQARGRRDVLDALLPHCLGLHTDTHSVHPTTMELLADLSYSRGCEAAFGAELRGFEAFRSAFDRTPAFWGGAGNTWSPEISNALKRLGIPAIVYAQTEVPDLAPHRFDGVLAFSQTHAISELDWADDARAAERTRDVLGSIAAGTYPFSAIFLGHPTKLRHTRYWDEPYFGGRTPTMPEPSQPLSQETYDRSKRNLAAFLDKLATKATIIGLDKAVNLPWRFQSLRDDERTCFMDRTAANLRAAAAWPVHRQGLDPENIVRKTLELVDTVQVAELSSIG